MVNIDGETVPRFDRALTVIVWYPADQLTFGRSIYGTVMRDGQTEVTLTGRAQRDVALATVQRLPLVVISHGYPDNRYLMSHLGENLASKGFVNVPIDHTDSLYTDQGAFGSTLLNRPLGLRFVIDQMAADTSPLGAITDTTPVGVIG